jgi:hypothetical protein
VEPRPVRHGSSFRDVAWIGGGLAGLGCRFIYWGIDRSRRRRDSCGERLPILGVGNSGCLFPTRMA